ncbi:hypothetical protein BS47DRAFT_404345 [Hydnum rufescens UP504]|uniref:Uncharacterized protein n=1 Tax=Hydnum rufescens UP504 TaxID=1448309 RepID=A0A9P6BCF5_9AGAM|nr:hypothetical protein BS47DRAFT_404345 [Hydnum rufescens UP504]
MKGVEDRRWMELWDALMGEWDATCEILCPKIRDLGQNTGKELTDLANDALVYSQVKTLPDIHLHLDVRDAVPSRLHHVSSSKFMAGLADITQSELQPNMSKLIREYGRAVGRYRPGSPGQVENDMREAMDRVWREVVDLDGGDASVSGDHNADVS